MGFLWGDLVWVSLSTRHVLRRFEYQDRDRCADGLGKVLAERRVYLDLALPDAVVLVANGDPGNDSYPVVSDFDRGFGVGQDVVIPIGVGVGATLGCKNRVTIVNLLVDEWTDALCSGAGGPR